MAPLAIARKLGLPRRILVILEGEGLANDATALILYRFAVVAITTGAFSLPKASGTFAAILAGEILFGLAVGWLSLRARHWARDPQVEITLSLLTPYIAYWIPEHLGGSGVIATVACGLYISWNGPLLISAATRLQGIFFWDLVIYLIEGLLFLLTGFQIRALVEKSKDFPIADIVIATLLVAAIVIVARFAWVYPATYLPRLLSQRFRRDDPLPNWRAMFVVGVHRRARRGVARRRAGAAARRCRAATPFPHRDLILLVVVRRDPDHAGRARASALPAVVRVLGLTKDGHREHRREREAEIAARRDALDAALASLDAHDRRSRTLRRSGEDPADAPRHPRQSAAPAARRRRP